MESFNPGMAFTRATLLVTKRSMLFAHCSQRGIVTRFMNLIELLAPSLPKSIKAIGKVGEPVVEFNGSQGSGLRPGGSREEKRERETA